MKIAHDPHSYSLPNDAKIKHLEWDAKVNFKTKTITATAGFLIENYSGTDKIILDTKKLNITKVTVDKKEVSFHLGDEKPFIGKPLTIPIEKDSKEIAVSYSTSPDADAFLWVDGDDPFLFSQSEAILGRTWIPIQDSPGIRITFNARVEVPSNLMALMSADNPQEINSSGVYTFKMEQPISSYLIALAVGNLKFKPVGKRTGVYAIPSVIEQAAEEFSDMEAMVDEAEKLYGPYVWGRYDLLILPPAFPFGGMENPKLTFATPTIIAGDKSLVSLVAHELAHSWSGNLVTNATWNDFWLNEGFTVYFEQRIMEAVYGRERSEMLAQIIRQELDETITEMAQSEHPEDSKLKLSLDTRDPDDGMTLIAYNKGYFFLRLLEETVGRQRFDKFVKDYFTTHSFQTMDTDTFIVYLKENLLDDETDKKINFKSWIFGEGLPANIPTVHSEKMKNVDTLREKWENDNFPIAEIPFNSWTYQEQYHFVSNLSIEVKKEQMGSLDSNFKLTEIKNNEVLFAWLQQSIRKAYTPAYTRLESFLVSVGRRKFVVPLYDELVKSSQKDLALSIYKKARSNYHAVTTGTVDKTLGL